MDDKYTREGNFGYLNVLPRHSSGGIEENHGNMWRLEVYKQIPILVHDKSIHDKFTLVYRLLK
jgi:hypothetical protein